MPIKTLELTEGNVADFAQVLERKMAGKEFSVKVLYHDGQVGVKDRLIFESATLESPTVAKLRFLYDESECMVLTIDVVDRPMVNRNEDTIWFTTEFGFGHQPKEVVFSLMN